MKHAWSNFLFPLTPGTRSLLLSMAVVSLATIIGLASKSFNLVQMLGLQSTAVWEGQIWRVLSYAFIAPTIINLILNGLVLVMAGVWLERVWSAKQLWGYCLLCAVGAGVTKVVVTPASTDLIVGNLGILFGLLAAWARLFGHEQVIFMGVWKTSVRITAAIFALILLLMLLPCAGLLNVLVLLSGGATGWVYLSLRWRSIRQQQAQTLASARVSRLEL